MSEPWMGLHNPERHEPHGGIADCIIETANPVMARWCTRTHPCRCCMDEEARRLAAEVEVLRVHIGARDIALRQCSEHAEALRAQMQAVRDWCGRGQYPDGPVTDWQKGFLTARREIRDILHGGDA